MIPFKMLLANFSTMLVRRELLSWLLFLQIRYYRRYFKELLALDGSKCTQSDEMLSKIIKNKSDVFLNIFNQTLIKSIETSTFPEHLKHADVKPVFKKVSRTDEKNCRRISILPNVCKIYERHLNKQLDEYFQTLLSKYHFGFRKGCSVINFLLPMTEKW